MIESLLQNKTTSSNSFTLNTEIELIPDNEYKYFEKEQMSKKYTKINDRKFKEYTVGGIWCENLLFRGAV
jgi:hypothetical protein